MNLSNIEQSKKNAYEALKEGIGVSSTLQMIILIQSKGKQECFRIMTEPMGNDEKAKEVVMLALDYVEENIMSLHKYLSKHLPNS